MAPRSSVPGSCVLAIVLAAALGDRLACETRAQVAFLPGVSAFPNGVTLSATPVVSADRRYVRMSLNANFNAIEGFDTYSVPAAVSGGPGGPGALGGLGGGGLGGGGGGQRFAAGMDGPIPFQGVDPRGFAQPAGPLLAGAGAAPDASAFLAGLGQPITPPRLSATMQGDAERMPTRTSARRGRTKPPARSRSASRVPGR